MLSATIITLNEETDLPRALGSVRNLADEIVVVDSGSGDKTLDIARKFGAKVFFRKFEDYASQKNFAASKAKGNWILSLDADEEITPELATEIRKAIHAADIVGYSIPRKNIIFGKHIKHTRWQSELDRHIWLWKKGKGRWVGNVHEEVVVAGRVGKLTNSKIHYQYATVAEFVTMINNYSDLEANQIVESGSKFSAIHLFGQPLYNFIVRFVYRLGFLDGIYGFILSWLMAYYHFVLWVKVWELKKRY